MQTRSIMWITVAIGSTLGGLIPELWGASFLSFSSLLFSALGGIAGVWVGYNVTRNY